MTDVIRHMPRPAADDDGLAHNPPHDTEAEQLVIAAVMHYPAAWAEAAEVIDRTDLYHPAHRLIWDVAGQLIADGKGVHPVAIRAEIDKLKRLREVGGLIEQLGTQSITPGMVGHFAQIIADRAHERRYDEHASELKAAIIRKASGDELDKLVSEFQQRETLRANTGHGPAHLTAALLNWDTFFATDFGAIRLLPGRLMAPGQQIAVVGDGKAGKSLFTQEWVWRMATGRAFLGDDAGQPPVTVLYLDAENGQQEVQTRFFSFGAGPGRMGTLHYASFPPIRPLDTPGGGADLMALVKATAAEVVVLDTVSRFISGAENDADTWLALYRNTLLPLKRDRIASIRLDHFGKDKDRGGRGSSAKNQDVDHVWELSAQGGGILSLKRTHTRTGIGPDEFAIRRESRRDGDNWVPGQTRHVIVTFQAAESQAALTEGTVEYLIAALDKAGVPDDAGNRVVRAKLTELHISAGNDKIARAVTTRKIRSGTNHSDVSGDRSADRSGTRFPETFPGTHPGTEETPGQTFPGTLPETSGTPPVPHVPPSQEGDRGEHPAGTAKEAPLCTLCDTPITNPDRVARGHDTHHVCPTGFTKPAHH